MVKDYRATIRYDVWRGLATTVPINDFRTQERTRFGGYGDLPTVAESAAYGALGSPTDEKASYTVAKRGGTEDVTLEMIKNDDVGVIRRIPVKLSRSAKRTLGKFVLDFLADNPKIHDGATLFHAGHHNLGAAALGQNRFRRRSPRHALSDRTGLRRQDRDSAALSVGAGRSGRNRRRSVPSQYGKRQDVCSVSTDRRHARLVLDGREQLVPVHRPG